MNGKVDSNSYTQILEITLSLNQQLQWIGICGSIELKLCRTFKTHEFTL
jgi:hypothetical protein